MSLDEAAVETLSGVRRPLSRLEEIVRIGPRPMPVATSIHNTYGVGAVLFLIHRRDGAWQAETALAERADSGWLIPVVSGSGWPDPEHMQVDELEIMDELRFSAPLDPIVDFIVVAGVALGDRVAINVHGFEVNYSSIPNHGAFVVCAGIDKDARYEIALQ